MNCYKIKHGDMYVLGNDVEFVNSMNNGNVYEEDMVMHELIPRINECCSDKKIILDIGGHIGSHTYYIPNMYIMQRYTHLTPKRCCMTFSV